VEVFRIQGGTSLEGEVQTSGAKNAALPIFAATLLTSQPCTIENVPDLSDIQFMADILRSMGATVERKGKNSWYIQADKIDPVAPYELVRKMRASICLMGPMVSRFRKAEVSLPGGCVIGPRPIDLHLKGLKKLGCEIEIRSGYLHVDATHLTGCRLFLGGRHGSTVTGTANLIMAAVLAEGTTVIDSAACEPEITDLCRMLISMGARIDGVGSHELQIHGVESLHGCTHHVLPDRIEAGTYILGVAMVGGDLTVKGARGRHLNSLLDKLEQIGVDVTVCSDDTIRVVRDISRELKPTDIITLPFPGYPTDLQAQMASLMTVTPGLSIITERVYPHRFMHVPEMQRMGADIAIEGASAIIKGVDKLSGAPVMASDLRASAALILAGIAATGETWVQRIYHLDRGYEGFDIKLRNLGANVERLPSEKMPSSLQIET
jgi:UDP-N-acetylglucosamine 1-carboxyvinyltransferase